LHKLATSIYGVSSLVLQEKISLSDFKRYAEAYINCFGKTNKNIFIAVYYAIAKITCPDNISKIEYIIFQTHKVGEYCLFNNLLINFHINFPDRKIICAVRDPRASWLSFRKRFPTTRVPFLICNFINFFYSRSFEKQNPNNIIYVKHEDFHCDFSRTLKKIIDFMGIDYEATLEYSSFYNNPYDGSNIMDGRPNSNTGVYKCYADKIYTQETWKQELHSGEIKFVELISYYYMKCFGYKKYKNKQKDLFQLKHLVPCTQKDLLLAKDMSNINRGAYYITKIPWLGNLIVFIAYLSLYVFAVILGFFYVKRITIKSFLCI